MITEKSLGRKTRHDPVQAYGDIHPHARMAGVFGVLVAFIILSYYSVIGGWILKDIVSYATTLHALCAFAYHYCQECDASQCGTGAGTYFWNPAQGFSSLAGGAVFALVFFILVFFAAVTSAIALYGGGDFFRHRHPWVGAEEGYAYSGKPGVSDRHSKCAVLRNPGKSVIANYRVFDFVGMLTDNILLPCGGIAMCCFSSACRALNCKRIVNIVIWK